jgi:hypothetical protein
MKVLVARFIALKQQHLPKTPRVVVSIEWIHLQRFHRQLFPKATSPPWQRLTLKLAARQTYGCFKE